MNFFLWSRKATFWKLETLSNESLCDDIHFYRTLLLQWTWTRSLWLTSFSLSFCISVSFSSLKKNKKQLFFVLFCFVLISVYKYSKAKQLYILPLSECEHSGCLCLYLLTRYYCFPLVYNFILSASSQLLFDM